MSPYILRTFSAMLLPNLKMKFYVFQDGYIIIYKVLYIYIYIHTYCQRTRCVSWICKLIKCIKISYQMNPDEKSMLTNITSPTKPVLTSLKKMGWKTSPPPAGPTSADDSLLQPLHSSKLSWPGSPKGLVPRLSGVFQDVKCFLWKCFHLLLLLYDV